MICQKIDLYSYFGVARPDGADGYLTTYLHDPMPEYVPNRKRPALVIFAGGSYLNVSAREKEIVALRFAVEGFNCFTLNYSCSPAHYPTQLIEGCMALAYVRENAQKLGVMPDKIATIGFSAGAHASATQALLYTEPEVASAIGKDRAALCRPDAMLLAYPVITAKEFAHVGSIVNVTGGDEKLKAKLSLEDCVTPDAPPTFVWHTAADAGVPCENSLLFVSALRKAGVPFELHIFQDGIHGLSVATEETMHVEESVQPWVGLAVTWLKNRGFKISD